MADIATLVGQLREELHQQARKHLPDPPDEPPPPVLPIAQSLVTAAAQRYNLPIRYREMLRALGQASLTVLPGPFQELIIYATPDLERGQVGFRGPRPGIDTFVAPHGWRRNWVVIAYDSGDPYFLDTTKPLPNGETQVWTAMQGTGTWEPILAASSLVQFLQILRVWTRIVVSHHDKLNPDEPLDDAHLRRLTAEITQIDAAVASHWTI